MLLPLLCFGLAGFCMFCFVCGFVVYVCLMNVVLLCGFRLIVGFVVWSFVFGVYGWWFMLVWVVWVCLVWGFGVGCLFEFVYGWFVFVICYLCLMFWV